MGSIISRPHLCHRASSQRPRKPLDSDEDAATAIRERALRSYQEQRTTSPPSAIGGDQPQESSSNFSHSAAPVTNTSTGAGAQPSPTMAQDPLAPVHPSVQFDTRNGRLNAGGDIGCGNVVGDHNQTTNYYAATPEDEHTALLGYIEEKLGTHVASDAVLSKAIHGEPSLCHPGTRENLLEHILAWVEAGDQQEASVAGRSKCIIGAPGAGKSTIMNTLVVKLLNDAARRSPGLITAHYSIRRSLQSTTDFSKVLPTLISQLTRGNLGVARRVHTLLADRQQTGIFALGFVEDLFLEAVKAHNRTVFVIIDALDEASEPAPLAATLSRVIQLSSLNLRLLLASRNEPIVMHSLDQNHLLDLIGHTIPTEESIREVGDYIAGRIRDGLMASLGRSSSWESWPSNSQLQSLSDRADGLFIWARTAVDFILLHIQKRGARKRDQMIEDIGNIGMADVNALYIFILRNYLENDEDDSNETTLQWMKTVLGLIVVTEHPLTLNNIIGFLGVEPDDFDVGHFVLWTRSILVPGTEPIDGSTTPRFHKTFSDFITTHRAAEFYINVQHHQRFAAERAFSLMEKYLRFDIFKVGSLLRDGKSGLYKTRDEELATRDHIPDGLIYACISWSYHLKEAGEGFIVSNIGSVRAFLHEQLLFWLEIVILVDKIEEAGLWLSELGERLESHCTGAPGTGDLSLAAFAAGASLFIQEVESSNQHNIPHIYSSLLTFSRRDSIVANHYRDQAISMVVSDHSQLPPRYDSPTFFSYQLENNASNIHPTITFWEDIFINRHASEATSVCFSPDKEQHLAVGYGDGSIKLWDLQVGNCVRRLTMGGASISSCCYSSNGALLACTRVSGNFGSTSCVWNMQTGDMVLGLLHSSNFHGSPLAFSPDRTLFTFTKASGGREAIEVKDVHSGEIIGGSLINALTIQSGLLIAWSPGATTIAAGSDGGNVAIWDVQSGEPIYWVRLHYSVISALSFSPDGRRLAAASKNGTIGILDTQTMNSTQDPFKGHTGAIRSICFSPDSCYIASSSDDRTIRFWDTKTGACVAGPIGGHSGKINAVAFSPDGNFLASGSDDGLVRLWDVHALLYGKHSEGKNARDAPLGSRLTDQSVIDDEGWTLAPEGGRLFWAPELYRACIWRPSTVKILGRTRPTTHCDQNPPTQRASLRFGRANVDLSRLMKTLPPAQTYNRSLLVPTYVNLWR